jgi:hypothetical protein
MHGQGIMVYKNGNQYIGSYLNGEKAGKGKWISISSNLIYEGNFEHGMKNGEGIITYKNGAKVKGRFKNDKLVATIK